MLAGTVLTILVLSKAGFNPFELFDRAAGNHPKGEGFLASGLQHPNAINSISFGLALLLGTAGLPHLLMRFFTVPDAKAARGSIAWGVLLIGLFFTMTMLVGVGARARWRPLGGRDVRRQPRHAAPGGVAGRRPGLSVGGDLFLAGHQRGGVRHHPRCGGRPGHRRLRRGRARRLVWRRPPRVRRRAGRGAVARVAAIGLGVAAIGASILAGETFNVSILVGLAFAVAASANLPALLMALFWSRFNTTGVIAGVGGGLLVSIGVIAQAAGVAGAGRRGLADPARQPGDHLDPRRLRGLLARDGAQPRARRGAGYHELRVRSETGIGAVQPV